MLVLSRKKGESIAINGDIFVKVVEIGPDRVRLGIESSSQIVFTRLVSSTPWQAVIQGQNMTSDQTHEALLPHKDGQLTVTKGSKPMSKPETKMPPVPESGGDAAGQQTQDTAEGMGMGSRLRALADWLSEARPFAFLARYGSAKDLTASEDPLPPKKTSIEEPVPKKPASKRAATGNRSRRKSAVTKPELEQPAEAATDSKKNSVKSTAVKKSTSVKKAAVSKKSPAVKKPPSATKKTPPRKPK